VEIFLLVHRKYGSLTIYNDEEEGDSFALLETEIATAIGD
jgi:hypothetical protein